MIYNFDEAILEALDPSPTEGIFGTSPSDVRQYVSRVQLRVRSLANDVIGARCFTLNQLQAFTQWYRQFTEWVTEIENTWNPALAYSDAMETARAYDNDLVEWQHRYQSCSGQQPTMPGGTPIPEDDRDDIHPLEHTKDIVKWLAIALGIGGSIYMARKFL